MTNCPLCRGDMEERSIRYVQDFEARVVIIENVPALVCSQCGEQLLDPATARRIQKLFWDAPKAPRTTEVPVYNLAEVA